MTGLAEKMISDTRPTVGRPKINEEQTPARFPAGTLARIDALVGPGKRGEFIRIAVEEALAKRKA